MLGFSRRRYKTFPKRRNYKSYSRKKTSPIKKLVRQEIARNVENKTQQYFSNGTNLHPTPSSGFDTDNVFSLGIDGATLIVTQGAGQGQRIGNTIKTKKLMFKGSIWPLPYDSILNTQPVPQYIKMWIFYDKLNPTSKPTPRANGDFFQNGSGNATFSNNLVDMWRPHNKDRYVVLKQRMFKLGYAEFTGVGGTYAGAVQSQGNFSNNDFKLNCSFNIDLTKAFTKIVKFNDTGVVPTTRGLYCMVQPVWANGGLNLNDASCKMLYMLDFQYEDA